MTDKTKFSETKEGKELKKKTIGMWDFTINFDDVTCDWLIDTVFEAKKG